MIELYPHQVEAVKKIRNGSVLCGDVGSGKSRTALVYYFVNVCGGTLDVNDEKDYIFMQQPKDLYIITTAKNRDDCKWEKECIPFGIKSPIVDSWNNIKKYVDVSDAFFIFDEQRVVGYGVWTKSFLKIAKKNQWIMLSATPGDKWSDYIPLFIANGFYKNKREFSDNHIVYDAHAKYPKILRYERQGLLNRYRNQILIRMEDQREAIKHDIDVKVDYDRVLYSTVVKDRWDPYENEPITETGKLFYLMRRVVNSDPSRIEALDQLMDHIKVIIFYNFNYELEMLRDYLNETGCPYGEWNGDKHEPIPRTERWAYLVQYSAGAEGWDCVETDTIIFFSQNYSYRMTVQAAGRIDRMNTPFKDLYFYHLRSTAPIDLAIRRALKYKRNFNERGFNLDGL